MSYSRRASFLFELIIAIIVVAISFVTLPMVFKVANNQKFQTTNEEALFLATTYLQENRDTNIINSQDTKYRYKITHNPLCSDRETLFDYKNSHAFVDLSALKEKGNCFLNLISLEVQTLKDQKIANFYYVRKP